MAALLPPLVERLSAATGAVLEIIPVTSSLFGPTTTCAGLLVGADVTRALVARSDLDGALIPAESLNDSRIFLDDVSFESVRAVSPVPLVPSYDFIDALSAGSEFTDLLRKGRAA
jgi:NifB/MoaA-like Fe-S oxidoreductase